MWQTRVLMVYLPLNVSNIPTKQRKEAFKIITVHNAIPLQHITHKGLGIFRVRLHEKLCCTVLHTEHLHAIIMLSSRRAARYLCIWNVPRGQESTTLNRLPTFLRHFLYFDFDCRYTTQLFAGQYGHMSLLTPENREQMASICSWQA